MAWDRPDVYYSPEKFGLEVVAAFERPDLSWEFDMFVIWRHVETGQLYYGSDSGCSCPSPFETFTTVDRLTPGTAQEVTAKAREWAYGMRLDGRIFEVELMLLTYESARMAAPA